MSIDSIPAARRLFHELLKTQRSPRAEALVPVAAQGETTREHPCDDARELAREAAAAFGELVSQYREYDTLTTNEAVARASEDNVNVTDHPIRCPPDQVQWLDLNVLGRRDPAAATDR